MFESREGKQLKKGMLVAIHFNAKRKDFSVVEMRSLKTAGKVLGYVQKGKIKNGYSLIGNAGQINVRKTNVKNRHAFLVGIWEGFDLIYSIDGLLYYNPYEVNTFVDYELFFDKGEIKEILESDYFQFDLMEVNNKILPVVSYIK